MTFGARIFLLALLLLPALVVGYVLMQRRPARYAVRYTNLDVLASVAGGSQAWRRHVGLAVFLLALAALLMGFARPKVTRLADREEATIVLVIDVSGSMSAKDVKPTRLEAAQVVVRDFLGDLPEKFQVGVVSFSEQAEVVPPATDDRDLATYAINYLYPQRGTAIGDGLARGVEVARAASPRGPTKNRPAAILLLSDGSQTEGLLLPLQGAARAKSFGIPIYTIALGTPEGVVEFHRFGTTRIIPVPPDPVTLKQIAAQTGGRFYEAESAGDLREAYERLGSLVSKVERKQEELASFDRAALVGGEGREIVADRNDCDRLRHPVHRHHVGELHVLRVFAHVADHRIELSLQETVRVRQCEQQRLQVGALGRLLGFVVLHRALVQPALARKRVDAVRVEPRPRRDGRIREVAAHENARRAFEAAMDQRDQQPVAAEQRAFVRFLLEHPLVRDKELEREPERSLRRVERIAGERMWRPGEVRFELRPQRVGRVPIPFRELEPARFAHRDDVRRGQRIAD